MDETPRPKARLLKGFRDTFGNSLISRQEMIQRITAVYQRYGFEALETPCLESLDVLGKYLPDADLPESGVFAFRDGKNWVGLRYDLTAPLSRVVAQYQNIPLPYRRYQAGPVFRQEKPGPGRYREFYQCDIDTVGTDSMIADAEVCCILCDALEALDVKRGDYIIRVNNRKILTGILQCAGVKIVSGQNGESATWLTVLRAIDKMDRIGLQGVLELLGPGRKDPSGDFTPGADLAPHQIDLINNYLSLERGDRTGICKDLEPLVAGSSVGEEGLQELTEIDELLSAVTYKEDRVVFDPTVVRGLAYYTGPVFEAEITAELEDISATEHLESKEDVENSKRRRFGSVAGGGRYDDLVERFLGRVVPATGASIGVDRLLEALRLLQPQRETLSSKSVLIVVVDRRLMHEYLRMADELRRDGIAAEVYLGSSGMKAQFKYADRRDIPAVVICGPDEFDRNEVSVKDLVAGRDLAGEIPDRQTWRGDRPAQVTINRADLAKTIKGILTPDLSGDSTPPE